MVWRDIFSFERQIVVDYPLQGAELFLRHDSSRHLWGNDAVRQPNIKSKTVFQNIEYPGTTYFNVRERNLDFVDAKFSAAATNVLNKFFSIHFTP